MPTLRRLAVLALLLGILAPATPASETSPAVRRPNIILIMADDK